MKPWDGGEDGEVLAAEGKRGVAPEEAVKRPTDIATPTAVEQTDASRAAEMAVARGGSAPAHRGLTAADLFRVQRSAGNAAVAALLQRAAGPQAASDAPSGDAEAIVEDGATQDASAVGGAQERDGAPGQGLPGDLKGRLEESLGVGLGGVRVHTDDASGQAAGAIGAGAYTSGQDIHFAANRYDPQSTEGQRLIAHEAAHAVQQQGRAPAVQGDVDVSQPGDPHEAEAEGFAQAFVSGGTAPVTPASTGSSQTVSRAPEFKPTFGGAAGMTTLEFLNASLKLKVPIKNARMAPSGTTMIWSWGAAGVDGVEKGDISPATGPTATFNAKAKKPTAKGAKDELAANVEVIVPGKPGVLHLVSPPMRVGVFEPDYTIEPKVVPGAKGGGSPAALKPSDVLEFHVTFDNVVKPKELAGAGSVSQTLVQDKGLHLARLGGVAIGDDQPFQVRPYRWEGDTMISSVYCHHAGAGTYKFNFNLPGTKPVSKEFPLKSETSLAFFLERCGAATDRHRALLASFDAYIHQGFMNYKAGYEAAEAAFKEYAERQRLTKDILLGILFAGLGGAAGGAVGGLVKFKAEQKLFAEMAKSATREAALGAVTDAPKDMAKYTVRLGKKLFEGGGAGKASTPDDATPDASHGGAASGVPGSLDPLNWYATVQKAKSQEETKVATTLQLWKTTTIDAIARGSTETIDFDPVNAITDSTKLGGKNVTELGTPPSAEAYEKNMWEAWIERYAYTLKEKVGCGQWGSRVEDNVGKELKAEMERVAKVLAEKGIDAAWLTDALREARRIADAKAKRSQQLF